MMPKTILYLLSFITAIQSVPTTKQITYQSKPKDPSCDNLFSINGLYYALDKTINVSGIPADMAIHWKSNKIFFTLISEEMRMFLKVLEPTGEVEPITVTALGQSTCIDNLNDVIYLASDSGVYKYKDDGAHELYTASGEDVMYVAVTNEGTTMYIATWPQNRVHKITSDGQKMTAFPSIPNGHGLTIDTKDNIYFVATKTSYILKDGNTIPIKIKGLPTDKMTGVFVTKSDEVYAMDETSMLYAIDADAASAKPLGSFNVTGVNTFVMDSSENVFMGVKGSILKFKGSEKNLCPALEKL